MIVILTGFPGSGKSTVGPRLAEHLGWQYYDIDDTIPQEFKDLNKAGKPVPQEKVDAYFKSFIRDLQKLDSSGDAIVSYVFTRESQVKNLKEMFSNTLFIYLSAPIDVLVDRVQGRKGHKIDAKLMREAHGSELDICIPDNHIDTNRPVEEVVHACLEMIRSHHIQPV